MSLIVLSSGFIKLITEEFSPIKDISARFLLHVIVSYIISKFGLSKSSLIIINVSIIHPPPKSTNIL